MSKGIKIALIVMGALGVTCFGGMYILWRQVGPSVELGIDAAKAGETFAATSDNNGCLREGATRLTADTAMANSIIQAMFVGACLSKSQPVTGFCDNVPASNSDSTYAAWNKAKCDEMSVSGTPCMIIGGAVHGHCHRSTKGGNG